MSLTVRLKNIGILKQAEFSLGDLTIICGENNTGKTYAAYALYGFLCLWREFIHFPVSDIQIQRLLTDNILEIEESEWKHIVDRVLTEACKNYTKRLDEIFAVHGRQFQNSEFSINGIDISDEKIEVRFESAQGLEFQFSKPKGSRKLTFTVPKEKEINLTRAKSYINMIINQVIFSSAFPKSFISSAERTGVVIFQQTLNFGRDRLLEEIGRAGEPIISDDLYLKSYQNYPWPIEKNIDFMQRQKLEYTRKKESFIAKEHPEVLAGFTDIVGGEYIVTENDLLCYIPKGTRLKLTMNQSSSTARSLLYLDFYLSCIAEKGDLLMIDEPELSLHPENQRRIARLFARLANLGVKVFITTHSDYIIKELNTLIMLNHDKPHLKRIAEENGYQDSELISVDQVKVYIAEKALLPLEEGQKRRRRGHTLVPAKIHPELGIGVSSFDKTIDDMNRIQDDIVWGEE